MVKSKKRNRKNQLMFIPIFLLGLLIFSYPYLSDWYYKVESNNAIKYFDKESTKLTPEEIERRSSLADGYNLSLITNSDLKFDDPYDSEKIAKGKKSYAEMLEIKEYIGHIEIPKIKEDIPMYAGTSEEVLQKGAGHLEGTSLPVGGNNTHTVITAHTGLPSKKLFTDLDKLKEGDIFYIHNFKEILAYKVDQIKVVEPSNFKDLLVVENKDYATLLTCTPYMINTHRLLVRGYRIPYVKEEHNASKEFNIWDYYLYLIAILVLLIAFIIFILRRKSKKNAENINEKNKQK